MLALKNNNKLAGNNGKPLVNAEITSLQVVNTNAFQFKMITTGPIRVYWGDGMYTDVPTKSTYYTITKTYSIVGTYNIVIVNPENVTALYFQNGSPWWGERINTNVSWFKQFYNLTRLELLEATFIGELGVVINNYLPKLNYLVSITTIKLSYTLNVSNCKNFWTTCFFCSLSSNIGAVLGKLDDVNMNLNCSYINFYCNNVLLYGDISGIFKNGYTQLTLLGYYLNIVSLNNLINTDDLIIPDTLLYMTSQRGLNKTHGNLITFDFKNLTVFASEGIYTKIDLIDNTSFTNFAANCLNFTMTYISCSYVRMDLSLFNRTSTKYTQFALMVLTTGNKSYGDITNILNNTTGAFYLTGGYNDGAIYGTLSENTSRAIGQLLHLSGIDISATPTAIKNTIAKTSNLILNKLPNFTGDISNANFKYYASVYGIQIFDMINLYADITTFIFDTWYNITNVYGVIYLYNNPHFTGNLGNLTLWSNKAYIYLQNCAYTNIGGFVNNVFTNRNTCLKATGGVTNINVANNVDNNLLTGVLQRGSLGTYTGNQNDLTEAQIDNLANGLDYTGTGTSTPWTHKEKIWCELNWKNSSTDNSSRYRLGSFTV